VGAASPALEVDGPAGSLCESPRKGCRPRAVARKEEGGRRVQLKASVRVWRTRGITLRKLSN